MADCRRLEPLLAAYVDGDVTGDQQARVRTHLDACPACQHRVNSELAVREVIREKRQSLTICAPSYLRERCAACACSRAGGVFSRLRGLASGRTAARLALAATLVLAVGAVILFSAGGSVELLAAQFAMDHMKCFQLTTAQVPVDPLSLGDAWNRRQGWTLTVPRSASDEDLELVDVRRCLTMQGFTAHILYRWRGQPLSVYVLNSSPATADQVQRFVSRFGQGAVLWSEHGRTYAVVGRGRPDELDRVARYVRTSAR